MSRYEERHMCEERWLYSAQKSVKCRFFGDAAY